MKKKFFWCICGGFADQTVSVLFLYIQWKIGNFNNNYKKPGKLYLLLNTHVTAYEWRQHVIKDDAFDTFNVAFWKIKLLFSFYMFCGRLKVRIKFRFMCKQYVLWNSVYSFFVEVKKDINCAICGSYISVRITKVWIVHIELGKIRMSLYID